MASDDPRLLDLEAQLQEARETIRRINRRCQLAEAALNMKVEKAEQRGSPAIRNYYYSLGVDFKRFYKSSQDRENGGTSDEWIPFDLGQRLLELEAEVLRLRAEQEWQPIETAPKDVSVLAWMVFKHRAPSPDFITWMESLKRFIGHSTRDGKPTHWMPLPASPTPKGGAV